MTGRRAPTNPYPCNKTGHSNNKGAFTHIIDKALAGKRLTETEIASLFNTRAADEIQVHHAADELRREVNGDTVTYVVNRNINYTNICYFGCGFCAFSKGRVAENLRERGYNPVPGRNSGARRRSLAKRRDRGLPARGHTPGLYRRDLSLHCQGRQADPAGHARACVFTAGNQAGAQRPWVCHCKTYLAELKQAGLGTLPGTAAEILDDEVRQILCPDKLNTAQWLEVMRTAHSLGLQSTATIMFGHVDGPQ